MKAREKVMITTITSAIELIISPASEQSANVIKAVEQSARKLAHKLIKTRRQEKKRVKKLHAKR